MRLAYLREVFTVSKTISRLGLTAIPMTADWGAPWADVELMTAYRCAEMKANRSPVVIATRVSGGATEPQVHGAARNENLRVALDELQRLLVLCLIADALQLKQVVQRGVTLGIAHISPCAVPQQ